MGKIPCYGKAWASQDLWKAAMRDGVFGAPLDKDGVLLAKT